MKSRGLESIFRSEYRDDRAWFRRDRVVLDSAEFVKVWMTSATLSEVADKLEISLSQASAKANSLRTKGVRLPRMSRNIIRNDVDELNKIVERYSK